jgi:hypothetical protein
MRAIFFFIIIVSFVSCTKRVAPSEFHLSRLELIKKFDDPTFIVNNGYDSVVSLLRVMYYNDQLFRDIKNPKYYVTNKEKQKKLDNENQGHLSRIISKFGILSRKELGLLGEKGLLLTIEHSNFSYKKSIQSAFEQAFRLGKIPGINYAVFIDKIAAEEKRFQPFGTQIIQTKTGYTFYPVDITTVNSRRASIGITQTISEYIKQFFSVEFDSLKYQNTS